MNNQPRAGLTGQQQQQQFHMNRVRPNANVNIVSDLLVFILYFNQNIHRLKI